LVVVEGAAAEGVPASMLGLIQQPWIRATGTGAFGSMLPWRTRQRKVAWIWPDGQRNGRKDRGAKAVSRSSRHKQADGSPSQPHAFGVGGRPAQHPGGLGKLVDFSSVRSPSACTALGSGFGVGGLRKGRIGREKQRGRAGDGGNDDTQQAKRMVTLDFWPWRPVDPPEIRSACVGIKGRHAASRCGLILPVFRSLSSASRLHD